MWNVEARLSYDDGTISDLSVTLTKSYHVDTYEEAHKAFYSDLENSLLGGHLMLDEVTIKHSEPGVPITEFTPANVLEKAVGSTGFPESTL